MFVGLLSLFYRELPKLGTCMSKGKHRHCAVRLKIFGVSSIYFGERGLSMVSKTIYSTGST